MTPRAAQAGIVAAYRRRRQAEDGARDGGYIIIIVLVLAMIILSLAGVAMQSSETNLHVTGSFTNTTQSRLASESGLNVATAKISAITALTPASIDQYGNAVDSSGNILRNELPASLSTTNLSTGASYTTTIQYYDASGNLFQSGTMPPSNWGYTSQATSIWPAKAVLTSVGTATNGASVKVVQSVSITPPSISVTTGGVTKTSSTTQVNQVSTTTTTLLPGYGEAIFSNGQVALSGNVSATTSAVTSPANIVAGGGIVCPNNVVVQGSIYSYSTSDQNLSNNCSISGGLYSASGITLSNNVSVAGDIWSYGSDGITLNNNVTIGGQAVATKGSITVNGSANVTGNATAAGAVNYNNNGSKPWYGTINPGAVTANSTTVGSNTMAAEPAFPTLSDPTQAQWQATEYKNVITVTNAGTFLNGVQTSTTQTCSTYFASQYLAPTYSASASQFNLDVNNATSPTAIDASACSAPNLYGPGGTATYSLKTDIALVVSGLQTSATNTFTSSSSTTHNLSVIVPAPGTGSINLSNATTFGSSVSTLMYTEGTFAAANAAVMNGQILAATSATGSNNFALTFSSSAALTLPGTTTTTTTTSSTPTTPTSNPPGTTSSSTTSTQTSGTTTTTTTVTTTTYPTGANSVTTTVVTTTPTTSTTSTSGSVSSLNRYQTR